MDEVRLAYIKMFQTYPGADHIAVAAMVNREEAFNDNGEFGSGFRLMKAICQAQMDNIALFMVREFGGKHLGPRRFTIMTDLADIALEKIDEQRRKSFSSPKSGRSRQSSDSNSSKNEDASVHDVDETPTEEHPIEEQEEKSQQQDQTQEKQIRN